jgi:hypothetical protein
MIIIAYSAKQVDVLIDSCKVLIPVITGYIVIVVGSLGQLEKKRLISRRTVRRRLIGSFFMAIVALGLWSGVLALMVDCSFPFSRLSQALDSIPSERLNVEWITGLVCAQAGLISFFFSVCLFAYVAYEMLSDVSEKADGIKLS